jgi:glycopeptide antibiotics resistance protein
MDGLIWIRKDKHMIKEIIRYIEKMAPYMLLALPIIAACRLYVIRKIKDRGGKTTICHEAGVFIFLLFMAGLASITIVPRDSSGALTGLTVFKGFSRVNLIPFRILKESWAVTVRTKSSVYAMINIAGNLVLFMPIGFFVSLLWENDSAKKAATAGFLTSLTIELCQLFQDRGTDIDDLWLNTVGALMGYGVFLLIMKLIKNRNTDLVGKFRVRKQI